MSAVIATLIGTLIIAAVVYDIARLITPNESRCPPLARLRGRRAALQHAERWCVGLRMHGRIDAATYQHRMSGLARGERRPAANREAPRRA
ncbi:hypothetical protein [Streptomyces sp. TRM68367]|uniref:hypothetical protein n=1 Tax=Streptomyces sp. TRM68367 TaxID=2758415 RepID=UPI00165A8558|nr:hypothetical protein [Streptomyces sp. TRM68367]MBC9725030.1 hypothetical protein [Streptomyces sp. TRM68367]